MEPKNHKVIRDFLTGQERAQIIDWIGSLEHSGAPKNRHLSVLSKSLMGRSFIFDISKTEKTRYISEFQSVSDVSTDQLPQSILDILDRISTDLSLPTDNVFLQAVDMNQGGQVNPHYDASLEGFINYKCNLSVLAEDYEIFIGDQVETIRPGDLYAFEASLYKHWTGEFSSRRVMLSFGFIVPYSQMGRSDSDPRVRLSKRIEKYFQRNCEI